MDKASQNTQSKQDTPSYHHYSLTFPLYEIPIKLNSVKFILLTDCVHRAEAQAEYLSKNLFTHENHLPSKTVKRLTSTKSRFSLYKVGVVLVSDYGLGRASMSIALHELLLMCQQAEIIQDVTLIRFGTCSGIKVSPGTICITDKVFNSLFQDYVEQAICSKMVRRSCIMDEQTAKSFHDLALEHPNQELLGQYDVKMGATVGTDDFYEEQGRITGAICEHSQNDELEFLAKLDSLGVISMDLESNYMSAMCHKLHVKFGIVCVAVEDRLTGDDSIRLSEDELSKYEQRLFWLNLVFVRNLVVRIMAYLPHLQIEYRDDQGNIRDLSDSDDFDDGTCGGALHVEPDHLSSCRRREE